LVSQWRVEDGSTAALMRRFYQKLHENTPSTDALRNAQVAFIGADEVGTHRYDHPFYWAGFQLIGSD
jgi:CHAT domain-containing protein